MRIHMIGIGGIGMSALAQLYVHEGTHVSGSDKEASPTTQLLEKKGVHVSIGQKAENVPTDVDLVVYSDAVWNDNPERMRAKELGLKEISYFEALGGVAKGKRTIAVTGTHGKTTTSALIAKILKDAGKEPTAIIGSIVPEFGSNFLAGKSDIFVVEACEYRNHFLRFHPDILVVTNMEWDHTDFFKSFDEMKKAFEEARGQAKTVIDAGVYKSETVPVLQLIGDFNMMNARAAKAAVRAAFPDIPDPAIDSSLAAFTGTWRRFEIKGATEEGALVVDDYAHHPGAISATLKAAREKFPDKTLVVAFHPHLYSRTRDLMEDFAKAFTDADEVLLAPIYPAREEPIEGVTSEALAKRIVANGKHAEALPSLDAVEAELKARSAPETVLITMGAGDIYKVADALIK